VAVLLLALLTTLFPAAGLVAAEESKTAYDGEPTDPERILEGADIEYSVLEEAGLADVPTEESEYAAWLEAIMDLLRSLGLLSGESDS
jgi:hypothetical protein